MKSAYELAMERLQATESGERVSLTQEQKDRLAEIDRRFKARIAERDVFLKKQLAEVRQQGNRQEEEALLKQIASERLLLEEEMEAEKTAVRKSG
ncbi:MAG: hypothetical protein ABQ298_14050 [Puniceicoccaceae bacterium]